MYFYLVNRSPLDVRVDATPKAMITLGKLMTEISETTFLSGKMDVISTRTLPLSGLKLKVSDAVLDVPNVHVGQEHVEIEMDKASFANLGQALVTEFTNRLDNPPAVLTRYVFPMLTQDDGRVVFTTAD